MKNKKGFTLIEIIAVIVILLTISLLATPAVLRLIRRNKEVASTSKYEVILKQAKYYARDNEEFLYNSNKKYVDKVCNTITVKQLQDAGYLKEISTSGSSSEHITDPVDNHIIDDMDIIVYIDSDYPVDPDLRYIGTYISLFKPKDWCNISDVQQTFAYTGDEQTYTVPEDGYYRLQVWGAQGGYVNQAHVGGNGGYSEGIVYLEEGETLYVYVGGSGNTGGIAGGFNGGGAGIEFAGGGGATDIRIEGNTLYHRIIVAGGGGSGGRGSMWEDEGNAGHGGGVAAVPCSACGDSGGGTQTAGGSAGAGFGYGEDAINAANCGGIDGSGGGGWYGGAAGNHGDQFCFGYTGGGGGSGFIYTGSNTVPEDYAVENHVLIEATTLTGASTYIPNYDGQGYKTGNQGDGYAKITLVGKTM